MFRLLLLGFLPFNILQIIAPTSTYAMTLDDEEEDAEDVAYLLEQAKKEGKSETFSKANTLLEKAKMYGVSRDDTQKASIYISEKKQARDERLEKERLARVKRETRVAQKQREQQHSSSSRYITGLGYDAQSYEYDKYTIWYRPYISISDGTHIYAKVTQLYRGDCYQLLVGSSDSSIFGNCSNCSNSLNSSWSCHANGGGSFTVNGDQLKAANGIAGR